MRIFLIGGTGYIGGELALKALDDGHAVRVLSRSAESDRKMGGAPVEIVRGSIDDIDTIASEARASDAVVYLAVPGAGGESEVHASAIRSVLHALEGSHKSFALTSGLAVYAGTTAAVVTPETPTADVASPQAWRVELERAVLAARARGVRATVIRPAIVYGSTGANQAVTGYLAHVTGGGVPFHVASGANVIPTVHVRDLARVYMGVLASESPSCSVNVATGAVLGFDLAHAAKELAATRVDVAPFTMDQAVAAMGPSASLLGVDLRVSTWSLVRDFSLEPLSPALLQALASGDVPPLPAAKAPADRRFSVPPPSQ